MNKILKLYSLGKDLDAQSLYSDVSLTKKELSQCLNCSRTSIVKWSNMAWLASPDFRSDTPLTDNGYDREAPLTPFQVWLVSRICSLMARLKNQARSLDYIQKNQDLFAKARFTQLYTTLKQAEEKIAS